MMEVVLNAKGDQTRAAYDAPTALQMTAEFGPAIGFLDIGLPVIPGDLGY